MDKQHSASLRRIKLDEIIVSGRIRKDNGDIRKLADDMEKHGLINPITVLRTFEEGYPLIAGLRRYEAAKLLGWEEIRVVQVEADDALSMLELEIAENESRKEFTVSEKLSFADRIKVIEDQEALERKSAYARKGYEVDDASGNDATIQDRGERPNPETGRANERIAKRVGFSSRRQFERASQLRDKRPELLEQVDSGKLSLSGAEKVMNLDAGIEPAPKVSVTREPKPIYEEKKSPRPNTVINLPEGDVPINISKTGLVRQEAIPIPVPSAYFPTTIETKGDPNSVKGANHDLLMTNPVYAGLFAKYQEMQLYAASLRDMLTNKLRTLRSIEQNNVDMQRRLGIDGDKGEFQ
jgi:ParB family chromosome partitioning protein